MGVLKLRRTEDPGMELSRLEIPELESFPGVREKKEQSRAASARLAENETRIKRAKDERTKLPAPMAERVAASLRGEAAATTGPKEDLSALYEERQVLIAANSLAKDSLDETIGMASIEVCKQFSAEHRARVKAIATRAVALEEAIAAESGLRQEILAAGFEITPPIAGFPGLAGATEINSRLNYFLRAVRAMGLEV